MVHASQFLTYKPINSEEHPTTFSTNKPISPISELSQIQNICVFNKTEDIMITDLSSVIIIIHQRKMISRSTSITQRTMNGPINTS